MPKLWNDNGVCICRARAIYAGILGAIHGRIVGHRLRDRLRGGAGRVAHWLSIAKIV